MLNYNDLNDILEMAQAQILASGCHGFLCGQLCVSNLIDEEIWQEFLDVQSHDDHAVSECYNEIQLLMEQISDQIQSPELDFQLLLPGDYTPLEDRVEALGEWCYGFLNGFGLGGITQLLSDDSRELIEDFTRISQVGVNETPDGNEDEQLMELIEYVRIGTIMIFDELKSSFDQYHKPEVLH